jgi:hypothetical protein
MSNGYLQGDERSWATGSDGKHESDIVEWWEPGWWERFR